MKRWAYHVCQACPRPGRVDIYHGYGVVEAASRAEAEALALAAEAARMAPLLAICTSTACNVWEV